MFSSALLLLSIVSLSRCCEVPQKVINGTKVTPAELQYQTVSVRTRDYYYYHLCSGSVVNPLYVITVAQCVYNHTVDMLLVVALLKIEYYFERDFTISEIIIHQDYNATSKINDIALLRLHLPFGPWNRFTYLRIPKQNDNVSAEYPGIVSGLNQEAGLIFEQVQVDIFDLNYCKQLLISVHDTHICAYDPCSKMTKQDYDCMTSNATGSILVINEILVGLITRPRPNKCLYDNFSNDLIVFTRVSSYITWIKNHIKRRMHDDEYPSPGTRFWLRWIHINPQS